MHLVGFYYNNISQCTVLWMSNKFCDSLACTQGQGQWQEPKVKGKEERRGKKRRGRTRATQVTSGGRRARYGTCEGDLPWIHKNVWQLNIHWGRIGLESAKHIFHDWKMARMSQNMHKSVIFAPAKKFQFFFFFQTTWMKLVVFYKVTRAGNENHNQNIITLTDFT